MAITQRRGKSVDKEENSFHRPWQQSAIMQNKAFCCGIMGSANFPSMMCFNVADHHFSEHYYSTERKICRTWKLLPIVQTKHTKNLQYLITLKILLQDRKNESYLQMRHKGKHKQPLSIFNAVQEYTATLNNAYIITIKIYFSPKSVFQHYHPSNHINLTQQQLGAGGKGAKLKRGRQLEVK